MDDIRAAMRRHFIEARELIETGEEHFICDALNNSEPFDDNAIEDCLEVIDEGIEGAYCLQTWLIKELAARNISVNPAPFDAPDTVGDTWRWVMRQARLAWLDKLIEEYSE